MPPTTPERRDWLAALYAESNLPGNDPEVDAYLAERQTWPACESCGQVFAPSEYAVGFRTCERCPRSTP